MEYSPAVRQRFERPSSAALAGVPGVMAAAEAGDRSLNAWVRFSVLARGGTLTDVEFNVFGCPHLIAACDWAAEWLRGRPVRELRALPIDELTQELGVPREKYGKLLRLEDALIGCARELERRAVAKGGE